MNELLHGGITDRILGAFYQVHRELGPGYLESVYAKGMEYALTDEGLGVEREVPVSVHFRGRQVGAFRADMIVESVVLLEFKAGDRLDPSAEAQLLNYLRGTRLELGLILHFGPKASFIRRVMTNDRKLLR
ncbi:MAG: GxxExxY protein [Thermoanaerobaculia bacterium]